MNFPLHFHRFEEQRGKDHWFVTSSHQASSGTMGYHGKQYHIIIALFILAASLCNQPTASSARTN
jgi:hypothetical protein